MTSKRPTFGAAETTVKVTATAVARRDRDEANKNRFFFSPSDVENEHGKHFPDERAQRTSRQLGGGRGSRIGASEALLWQDSDIPKNSITT